MSNATTAPSNGSDDIPKSAGARALAAVPVVLTVMATVLAGLSSSEMTRSMYYRSLAAQNQAKAGSQWEFFQAKRIRGTMLESAADLARGWAGSELHGDAQLPSQIGRLESAIRQLTDSGLANSGVSARLNALREKLDGLLKSDEGRQALRYLSGPDVPAVAEHRSDDPAIQSTIQAVRSRQTEAQTAGTVARINPDRLLEAIELAETNAEAFDKAGQPVNHFMRSLESVFSEIRGELNRSDRPEDAPKLNEARTALKDAGAALRLARQDFTARRYAKEAGYNQETAELYEVLVRRNGFESDRHRERSKNFFYAMLCAQAGVTIASFALARSRQSLFWAVAGFAGVTALSFGTYVYIAM
jgi:hypothetical protein